MKPGQHPPSHVEATGLHPLRVLVPMLGRPHLAGPLADTAAAPVLFICSPDDHDTIKECRRTADTIVVGWQPGHGDYARKINLGYRETTERWLFLGASDLVFHPHWDRFALQVGEAQQAGVVGTQDTANPAVKRGQQSTHSLVRRAYIEEQGGTFDGSGDIYSEAYDHQWIDIELVETAKLRKRWAFSPRSIVEHLHPCWGTAEMDATYEKALRSTRSDQQLYIERMKLCRRALSRNPKFSRV